MAKRTWKLETVKEKLADVRARMEMWDAVDVGKVKICITAGNDKIGKTWNFSLAPVITCGNCAACMRDCYAVHDLWRDTTRDARARNTSVFYRDRDFLFDYIRRFIKRKRKAGAWRWHVSGELVDMDRFNRIVEIAREFPAWTFWIYTKMYGIVNAWIDENGPLPSNLSVMFSEWLNIPVPNPHGLPTFHTVEKASGERWLCPGKCEACKAAHRGCPFGEPTECLIH